MKANAKWAEFLQKKKPKRQRAPTVLSEGEERLWRDIKALKIPLPVRQYRPVKTRRWTVDFCWPDHWLIIEVQGGIWMHRASHSYGRQLESDFRKYNALQLDGWIILQVSTGMVESGEAITAMQNALTVGTRHKRQAI